MRTGGVQNRSITGEADDQSIEMARLTVKFADLAGNGFAHRRAMLLVGRTPADLPAVFREYPIRRENGLGGAAGSWIGVNSKKAAQLVGREGRLCFDLDEVEAVEIRSEAQGDGSAGKQRNRLIDRDKIACVVPQSPSDRDADAERDEAEAEFSFQLHTVGREAAVRVSRDGFQTYFAREPENAEAKPRAMRAPPDMLRCARRKCAFRRNSSAALPAARAQMESLHQPIKANKTPNSKI